MARIDPAVAQLPTGGWTSSHAKVVVYRAFARALKAPDAAKIAIRRSKHVSSVAPREGLPRLVSTSERDAIGSHTAARFGGRSKRAIDIVIASIAIVSILPLAAIVATLIRVSMGSPVIFRQSRVGRDGKLFDCYKFRTMVSDADVALERILLNDPRLAAEWREAQKLRKDPRITRLGHLLRKSSLDELPQFVNVLRGEMSCVGPRPIVPEELRHYGSYSADYLKTLPGLTGMWQTSGRTKLSYSDRVKLDRYYARRQSTKLDIAILVQTVPAVLRLDEVS